MERGFQEPANAYEEARRGAYDPTYLYYTAGKLQIYKLREDYKRAHGSAYSLEKFHTEFIKQGSIPIKLMRQDSAERRSVARFVARNHLLQILCEYVAFEIDPTAGPARS